MPREKKMLHRPRFHVARPAAALTGTCALVLACTSARGDAGPGVVADPGLDELEAVIVTATRLPIRAFDVPAMAYAESIADVQRLFQSRTLPQAIGEVPGVLVQKTANGQGSPFMRGYTGFRNVLLVDGIRLNNSVFRDGPNQYWNTIDTFSISRIEVLKGAASVLYGSDAIGGAVNVLSDIPGTTKPGLSPRAVYRYSDAESSNTFRGDLTYVDPRLRATAGYTYKDYGDVEAGGNTGVQEKTGYDEQAANARIEFDLSPSSTLLLGYQYVDQDDAWRTHRTIYGISWNGTTVGTDRELSFDQQRQLGYLQLQQKDLGTLADTMIASVSYQSQSEDQYRLRSNLRYDELGFDVYTTGLWVQFDKQWGPARLMYGLDHYGDEVTSYNVEYNANGTYRRVHSQGPVADDASYDLTGAFVQAIVQVMPRLSATIAGRYTWASVDARKVEDPVTFATYSIEDDWTNFSGKFRLSFMPIVDGPWNLYAGISQAFRAPNLSDLTRLDTARSGELETPSPGLDPETYVAWEAGVKYEDGRLGLQAAYFETDGNDLIIRTPTGRVIAGQREVTKTNAADSNVDGIEWQLSYLAMPGLTLYTDGMWIDGWQESYPVATSTATVKEPIDLLMPLTWRAGARWVLSQPRLRLDFMVEHADEQDDLSSRDKADTQRIPPGGTPGYTTLNLRSEWVVRDGLVFSLAFDNLTDEDYRVHGSGVNEPGRNLIASVSVTL
jgi:hemoglobin/transferrin/lactoferrin receptor protein